MGEGDVGDSFIGALLDDDAEALYEQAPCGYLSTDADGLIIKANQTFAALSGRSRDELVTRLRFADLLSPGGKIYHETHYAPMLRMSGSAREVALDLVRPDGSRLPILLNAAVARSADGAPRVIRLAVFDATQRREYERELLAAKQRAAASEEHATALARTLQQTFVPPGPPEVRGLDVAVGYRPAGDGNEVGGDFHDVFQVSALDWMVIVGDVRGKGVDAAVVTALARHTLRAAVMQNSSPAYALRVLNEILRQDRTDRFCTVAAMRLRQSRDGWRATLCCAGHPLPLCRSGAETVHIGVPGTLLGILDDVDITETDLALGAGDVVLLYTDGVPDGRRGKDFYGEERLHRFVNAPTADAAELVQGLLADVITFQGGLLRDDVALVAVRVPPDSPQA